MAGLPKTTKGETIVTNTDSRPAQDSAFSFEDADTMPGAAEISATKNPFQDKVRELARTGKATSLVLPNSPRDEKGDEIAKEGTVKWARDMIRRAANNIEKGAKTRVVPEKGRDGYSRVWFSVGVKTERKRTK